MKAANSRRHQASRQYKTNDARWRRIREAVLSQQPVCRLCWEYGEANPSVDVDHIDGDPWNNRFANLQGLCRKHHAQKTASETRREKNGRFRLARNN